MLSTGHFTALHRRLGIPKRWETPFEAFYGEVQEITSGRVGWMLKSKSRGGWRAAESAFADVAP